MSFLFMALSLMRMLAIQLFAIKGLAAPDGQVAEISSENASKMALEWLVPAKNLVLKRPIYSIITVLWVLCLIAVPVLLLNHILLWERGIGFGFWPNALTVSGHVADAISASILVLTTLLIIHRAATRNTRPIKEPADSLIFLTLLITVTCGILMAHPTLNPFNYSKTMLIHILSAEAIFILLPMSKVAHTLLFPIGSFMAGKLAKLPAEAKEKAAAELFGGKEVGA